jgi:hypothetical protein
LRNGAYGRALYTGYITIISTVFGGLDAFPVNLQGSITPSGYLFTLDVGMRIWYEFDP